MYNVLGLGHQNEIHIRLVDAVNGGCLETVRNLINSYGLSYSPGWAQGYVLLRDALKNKHVAIAKLLLTSGCKVNHNSKNKALTNTPLHYAVTCDNVDIVEMLLNYGAYIDAKNGSGETPLCYTINPPKLEQAELLLQRGANVNVKNKNGSNVLHTAASFNNIEIVEILLKYGGYVNCVCNSTRYVRCIQRSYTHKGFTPLHFAVKEGNTELVAFLLSRGANIDIKGEDGTPLHVAAINKRFNRTDKDIEMVKLLLNKGCDVNATTKDRCTPLHFATQTGYEPIVKLLLKHGAKVNKQDKDGRTILYLAVREGHFKIVEEVLKYCPDIKNQSNRICLKIAISSHGEQYKNIVIALLEYGFTVNPEDANDPDLLHTAVGKGYLKIVEDLLKYGANINGQDKIGKTPIFHAIENAMDKESIEMIKTLLQHDIIDINVIDKTGRSALHYVVLQLFLCEDQIAKLLLHKGANVDTQTESGETPLLLAVLLAVQTGHAKVVETLLEHNANVNCKLNDGITVLHLSALRGNKEICLMLLNKGSNVNAEAENGITALHIATARSDKEVVKILLKFGAKVDAKIYDMTPLHLAAQNNSQDIVETLLKFGAYIDCKDKYGRTALHMASAWKNEEVIITLLQYGSDINNTCRNKLTPLYYAVYQKKFFNDDFNSRNIIFPFNFIPHKTFETIIYHIIKMKTAKLYVNKRNLRFYSLIKSKMPTIRYKNMVFQEKCEMEIACMKSKKFDNSNVTLYDILVKDTNSLATYLRNENIVQVLKSNDFKENFPMYASIIDNHVQKGMERLEVLEQNHDIFHVLFKNFPELPYECTEKIFSYLSNEELRILINAYKPLSISNLKSNMNNADITSSISEVLYF